MEEYLGMIKLFAGNFAPENWMICDGSLLPVNQNQALFYLLGTAYGGDGVSNFAIPDFRARVPVASNSTNLQRNIFSRGQKGGEVLHTLSLAEMPAHTHTVKASSNPANMIKGSNTSTMASPNLTTDTTQNTYLYGPTSSLATLSSQSLGSAGGGQGHNNMQPFLGMNYIICVTGMYPTDLQSK